jgi:hypothetical protein
MNRPYLTLNSTDPILFDGLAAVCWFINMHSDVTSPRIHNMSPGEMYTFVFTQDAVGGHAMNWPANCLNAASIDPAPNAITVQNLICDTGGMLYANVAPTGSAP